MNDSKPTKMDPVADLLGSARIVSYKADFAHLTGSITAGLLLSQFWYWSGQPTAMKRDGWFYITMDEISEQTGMIREEQVTARERLKDLGVLEEKRQGVPAQLWFRLDKEKLYELLREFAAAKETALQNAGIPQSGKAAVQNAGIPQSVVRELRRLARGNATGKDVGMQESITIDVSKTSLRVPKTRTRREKNPPINPPEGEEQEAMNTSENRERRALIRNKNLQGLSAEEEARLDYLQVRVREQIADAIPRPFSILDEPEDDAHREVWSSVLSLMREKVNGPTYNAHIRLLEVVSMTDTTDAALAADRPKTVVLRAPSEFTRTWVEKRCGQDLAEAFTAVLGVGVELRFVAGGG